MRVGGHSGYVSWFLWAYVGTFVTFTLLAVWWLVDVVRRPASRFPGSWAVPRLRWGLVPASWLFVIGAQLLGWVVGLALSAGAAAQRIVSAAGLGLVTLMLVPAVVTVGMAYLLRVVFPRTPGHERFPDEASEGSEGVTEQDETSC
jgi:hypothetical protein